MTKKKNKPDVNFFECKDPSVLNEGKRSFSNQQRRLFGLVENTQDLVESQISRFNKRLLAYQAQGGVNWGKLTKRQMEQRLKSSLSMGRSLEIFLAENLIHIGGGFDHIPPFDMDQFYAIDMMSRVPFKSNKGGNTPLSTLGIATQITVSLIPGNDAYIKQKQSYAEKQKRAKKYEKKYQQMQTIAFAFQNKEMRKRVASDFGRLNLPDVVSFLAVNGRIGKTCVNSSGYAWNQYNFWRKANFDTPMLSDYLKKPTREAVEVLAEFVRWTQTDVLLSYDNPPQELESLSRKGYITTCDFDTKTNELTCKLTYCDEKNHEHPYEDVAIITYFLQKNERKKLKTLEKIKK